MDFTALGPTSVGDNSTTVSVRAGPVGAQVSSGDKGANLTVSVGPQVGFKFEPAGKLPANAGAQLFSTRVPVGSEVKSLVNQTGQLVDQAEQKMADAARSTAGCGTAPCFAN